MENGSLRLTQEGLIKRVLEATKMQECRPTMTPAVKNTLGPDVDGEPAEEQWNYRSVVGTMPWEQCHYTWHQTRDQT